MTKRLEWLGGDLTGYAHRASPRETAWCFCSLVFRSTLVCGVAGASQRRVRAAAQLDEFGRRVVRVAVRAFPDTSAAV